MNRDFLSGNLVNLNCEVKPTDLHLLEAIMRIAIALLKLNFASWLRTNACKKRAFINRVVDKIQTTVTVFSYFCKS